MTVFSPFALPLNTAAELLGERDFNPHGRRHPTGAEALGRREERTGCCGKFQHFAFRPWSLLDVLSTDHSGLLPSPKGVVSRSAGHLSVSPFTSREMHI